MYNRFIMTPVLCFLVLWTKRISPRLGYLYQPVQTGVRATGWSSFVENNCFDVSILFKCQTRAMLSINILSISKNHRSYVFFSKRVIICRYVTFDFFLCCAVFQTKFFVGFFVVKVLNWNTPSIRHTINLTKQTICEIY